MSVSDFVCYVLRVPTNLDGFKYACIAIQYILEHNSDHRFYEHLQEQFEKSKSCIEKSLRLAKVKAVNRMNREDYMKIFCGSQEVTSKEFICYAAQFYRKEYMNED